MGWLDKHLVKKTINCKADASDMGCNGFINRFTKATVNIHYKQDCLSVKETTRECVQLRSLHLSG